VPLSSVQVREMDQRSVVLTTYSGMAAGVGSLRVSTSPDGAEDRVALHFGAPGSRCLLDIPPARLDVLARSWDGTTYRYALPPGAWSPSDGAASFLEHKPMTASPAAADDRHGVKDTTR
jgi:hypothetical protein